MNRQNVLCTEKLRKEKHKTTAQCSILEIISQIDNSNAAYNTKMSLVHQEQELFFSILVVRILILPKSNSVRLEAATLIHKNASKTDLKQEEFW